MAQPGPAQATAAKRITITYANSTYSSHPPNETILNKGSIVFNGGTGVTGCTVCFTPTDVFGDKTNVSPGDNSALTAQRDNVTVTYTMQPGLNAACPQPPGARKEHHVGNGGSSIKVGS